MAIRDLNATVGTVTRDATRHTGDTGPGKEWQDPAKSNDGISTTFATVLSNMAAFSDYLVADLGAVYRVSAFKWYASSGDTYLDLPQYGSSPTGPWTTLTVTETGGRATSPNGATLDFAPVDARYFSMRASAAGFHPAISLNTWQIMGDDVPAAISCGFTATPVVGPPPLVVAFTDTTTGTPTSWLWDFGDGTTSTVQHPSKTYTVAGTYTVTLTATRAAPADQCTRQVTAFINVQPVKWDVFAANNLGGPLIASLDNATERFIRIEEDGAGAGGFTINRHSTEATPTILAKGNLVRVAIPEISNSYIGAFFIEQGDFELLSSDEQGAELLTFGGRGAFSYLGRARMWSEAYSTGLDVVDTWTKVWSTGKIANPVGSCLLAGDTTYAYVISQTTRKIYKIRQSDRVIVGSSPALWAGSTNYAGGLCADPADSTKLWAIETPWALGGAGNTKIRRINATGAISGWNVDTTFDLGSAIKLTDIQASSTDLWTSKYDGPDVQKRSKATGAVVTSYDIVYNGVAQVNATGLSINGTEIAMWFLGKKRALIANLTAPETITRRISTVGISAFGGSWTTEGGNQFFYPVSYTADVVWKYQLTSATARDPVSGEWRLDEGTPGAILARIMAEIQHNDRPQQPVPSLTYGFTFLVDSAANTWAPHPGTAEFTARIGDLVDEVVARLIPYGLTLQMSPSLRLDAYNEAAFGVNRTSATFAAGKVRVEGAINAAESLRRRMDDRKTDSHLLVGGDGNVFGLAISNTLGYVREGFLATDLTDSGSLVGTGDAELARQRRDEDAQVVVIPWGNTPLSGIYLPGPAGTNGHYWVGDRIRLDSGSGPFDLVEVDRDVKAITIEELDNGAWRSVVDLASVFYPIHDPAARPAPSSIGGTTGAGGGTIAPKNVVIVKDTTSGDATTASTIESADWGVTAPGVGRAEVHIRGRSIRDATDSELDTVVDGDGIAWDADAEAWVPAGGAMFLSNELSPAQLVANTDNYNPTGLSTAHVLRLSTDAARNLTGIVAPAARRALILANVGAFDLVLVHDATSTAANRFYCPNDTSLTLQKDSTAILVYDTTSSRWRVVGGGGGGSVASGITKAQKAAAHALALRSYR